MEIHTVQCFDSSGLPVGDRIEFTSLERAEAVGYGVWRMKLPGVSRIDVVLHYNDGRAPLVEGTFRMGSPRPC